MRKFIVTLRHDNGTFTIEVCARSADAARAIVREVENCPNRAIRSVRPC